MSHLAELEEAAALLEVPEQDRVRDPERLSLDQGDRVREGRPAVEGVEDADLLALSEPLVVNAEARRDVDDPRTLVGGDEIREDDPVPPRPRTRGVERRLVGPAGERARGDPVDDLDVGREVAGDGGGGEDVPGAVLRPNDAVLEPLPDGDEEVRGERPGSGRPDEEHAVFARALEREPKRDGRVGRFVVPLGDLVGGEGGLAPRTVRKDVVTFLEQPVVEEGLEGPPHALDVRRVHRPVRVVVVEPVAEQAAHLSPDGRDFEGAGPARLAEPLHAVRLDLLLRLQAEALLDLELDRKAVAVPSRHRAHEVDPAHPTVAQLDVLQDPRDQVTDMGRAVGGRGPFGEPERRTSHRSFEDGGRYAGLLPVREDAALHGERRRRSARLLLRRHGRRRRSR